MSRRLKLVLLVVLLALMVNLPLATSLWAGWQVERAGTDVTAELVDHRVAGSDEDPRYWLYFRYPEEIDESGASWPAEVDRTAYDAAVASGEVPVRVLEERTSAYRVDGGVTRRTGLVLTLLADVALLGVVLLVRRRGSHARRPALRVVATGDLEACPPGTVLERLDGPLHLVRGEVVEVDDDEVVLDLGDRVVVVVLDGHANRAERRQSAQVRGLVVE